MRVLLDSNIVLDYLGANEGFTDEAEEVLSMGNQNGIVEFVSSTSATDIFYVLKRAFHDREVAYDKFEQVRKIISILPVTESDIDKALARKWKDFEDAVQYTVAESNNVDVIVTRNVKDFEETSITSLTPTEFVKMVKEKTNIEW